MEAPRSRSMVEARGGAALVHRVLLALQAWQLAVQIGDQHVREVVREALLDDDAEGGQVGAVGRERVGGDEPAALAEAPPRRRRR